MEYIKKFLSVLLTVLTTVSMAFAGFNGVHYINLPSYMYLNYEPWKSNNGGNLLSGCGYIAEVYKNEVVLRARNYALKFYMPVYEKSIKLVK